MSSPPPFGSRPRASDRVPRPAPGFSRAPSSTHATSSTNQRYGAPFPRTNSSRAYFSTSDGSVPAFDAPHSNAIPGPAGAQTPVYGSEAATGFSFSHRPVLSARRSLQMSLNRIRSIDPAEHAAVPGAAASVNAAISASTASALPPSASLARSRSILNPSFGAADAGLPLRLSLDAPPPLRPQPSGSGEDAFWPSTPFPPPSPMSPSTPSSPLLSAPAPAPVPAFGHAARRPPSLPPIAERTVTKEGFAFSFFGPSPPPPLGVTPTASQLTSASTSADAPFSSAAAPGSSIGSRTDSRTTPNVGAPTTTSAGARAGARARALSPATMEARAIDSLFGAPPAEDDSDSDSGSGSVHGSAQDGSKRHRSVPVPAPAPAPSVEIVRQRCPSEAVSGAGTVGLTFHGLPLPSALSPSASGVPVAAPETGTARAPHRSHAPWSPAPPASFAGATRGSAAAAWGHAQPAHANAPAAATLAPPPVSRQPSVRWGSSTALASGYGSGGMPSVSRPGSTTGAAAAGAGAAAAADADLDVDIDLRDISARGFLLKRRRFVWSRRWFFLDAPRLSLNWGVSPDLPSKGSIPLYRFEAAPADPRLDAVTAEEIEAIMVHGATVGAKKDSRSDAGKCASQCKPLLLPAELAALRDQPLPTWLAGPWSCELVISCPVRTLRLRAPCLREAWLWLRVFRQVRRYLEQERRAWAGPGRQQPRLRQLRRQQQQQRQLRGSDAGSDSDGASARGRGRGRASSSDDDDDENDDGGIGDDGIGGGYESAALIAARTGTYGGGVMADPSPGAGDGARGFVRPPDFGVMPSISHLSSHDIFSVRRGALLTVSPTAIAAEEGVANGAVAASADGAGARADEGPGEGVMAGAAVAAAAAATQRQLRVRLPRFLIEPGGGPAVPLPELGAPQAILNGERDDSEDGGRRRASVADDGSGGDGDEDGDHRRYRADRGGHSDEGDHGDRFPGDGDAGRGYGASAASALTPQPLQPPRVSVAGAAHCAACQHNFNLIRRGANCASCGYVFCSWGVRCLSPADPRTGLRFCAQCLQERTHLQTRRHAATANILVEIVAARNVVAADANDLSDPYCVAHFEGQTFRTPIIQKTLNPTFNCQLLIPWVGVEQCLSVALFDYDSYSYDDFLGLVFVPLHELTPDVLYEDWFPLTARPGGGAGAGGAENSVRGHVLLRIVVSSSVMGVLFESVWNGVVEPGSAEFQASAVVANIKRLAALLASLNIGYWVSEVKGLLQYRSPIATVLFAICWVAAAVAFPSDKILPFVVFLVWLKLLSNGIEARLNERFAPNGVRTRLNRLHSDASGGADGDEAAVAAAAAAAAAAGGVGIGGGDVTTATAGLGPDAGLGVAMGNIGAHSRAQARQRQRRLAALRRAATESTRTPRLRDSWFFDVEEELAVYDTLGAHVNAHDGAAGSRRIVAAWPGAVGDDDDREDDAAPADGDDSDSDEDSGIISTLRRVRRTLATIQNTIGFICDNVERVQNVFRWRNPRLSRWLLTVLTVLMIVFSLVPLRILLILLCVHQVSKRVRLLIKKVPPVEEITNFLERMPTDADLYANKKSVPRALLK